MYMIDSTVLLVEEMGTETPQFVTPRSVIDSAATFCSGLKKNAEKCMFDVFYIAFT